MFRLLKHICRKVTNYQPHTANETIEALQKTFRNVSLRSVFPVRYPRPVRERSASKQARWPPRTAEMAVGELKSPLWTRATKFRTISRSIPACKGLSQNDERSKTSDSPLSNQRTLMRRPSPRSSPPEATTRVRRLSSSVRQFSCIVTTAPPSISIRTL